MSESATYLGKDGAAWAQTVAHDDPVQRRLAVYALGEIRAQAQPIVPALDAALQDQVNWVRVWTAAAIAKATGDPVRLRRSSRKYRLLRHLCAA